MTQVTRLINAESTQHNDYDYTQTLRHLIGGVGGVHFTNLGTKPEFALSGGNIAPGIATVVCNRVSSTPIANQKFLAVFYSDANVPVVTGPNRKIFIEIEDNLIQNPALILDIAPSTTYTQGLNIGSIKSATARPTHTSYIKLFEYSPTSVLTDHRKNLNVNNVDLSTYTGAISAASLAVSGNATVGGTLGVTGNQTIGGTLNVTGQAIVQGVDVVQNILNNERSFGDGSDGNVTVSGAVTLIRDMYYNNLTISAGGVLNPNGFRVFVKGTLSGNGIIRRNGNNGNNGGNGSLAGVVATGGTAGAVLNQGSLAMERVGGNGGNSGNSAGGNGQASNPSMTNVNGVSGGVGGNTSWSPNTGAGGAGTPGVATRGALYNKAYNPAFVHFATINWSNPAQYTSIPGSSGGGGGATVLSSGFTGGAGGGAGGNGGFIWIACAIFTFTGTIQATGGNGGNGGNGVINTNWSGGGGGGGGGNGGIVLIVSKSAVSGFTQSLAGGTGGLAGANGGTGGVGATLPTAGTAGNTGQLINIVI